MDVIELPDEVVVTLTEAPETGMGYQWGRLVPLIGVEEVGVFLGSHYFVPEQLPDLTGGLARDFSKLLLPKEPAPIAAVVRFGSQVRAVLATPSMAGTPMSSVPPAALPPPYSATTSAKDVFYRVSAYPTDRRIRSDNSLAPLSFSTTDTDITVVPNGLAAVGRYALPTRMSARHVFEIRPGAGTTILFGTVTPNYGLAGGGVEVYFPYGTTANTVTFLRTLPEK